MAGLIPGCTGSLTDRQPNRVSIKTMLLAA